MLLFDDVEGCSDSGIFKIDGKWRHCSTEFGRSRGCWYVVCIVPCACPDQLAKGSPGVDALVKESMIGFVS